MFLGLLVLFGWCVLWSGYESTRPQSTRRRISNALHLAMSVVMLLMVAGPTWSTLTAVLPTPVLAGLFALATLWFVRLAVAAGRSSGRAESLHFVGHAAMFAAMTWHLAAMAVMAVGMAGGQGGSGHDHAGGHHHGGGMELGDWMTVQSGPGGVLWWFAVIGLPLMVYLLGASLRSLWLAGTPSATAATPAADCTCRKEEHRVATPGHVFGCHEERPRGSAKFRLAALSDFAMTGGMFWMSTGLLVPVLPVIALLAG